MLPKPTLNWQYFGTNKILPVHVAQTNPELAVFCLYRKAVAEREAKKLEDSLKSFVSLVEKHPHDPRFALEAGRLHLLFNQPQQAQHLFENFLNNNPNESRIELELGRLFMEQGQYPQAESIFSKMLQKPESKAKAHVELAKLYQRMGQTEQALQNLETCVNLAPRSIDAHRLLARMYLQLGNFTAALEACRTVETLKPNMAGNAALIKYLSSVCKADSMAYTLAGLSDTSATQQHPWLNLLAVPSLNTTNTLKDLLSVQTNWFVVTTSQNSQESDALSHFINSKQHLTRYGVLEGQGYKILNTALVHDLCESNAVAPSMVLETFFETPEFAYLRPLSSVGKVDTLDLATWQKANPQANKGEKVYLMTRHGKSLFGGGEYFLRGMAKHWADFGYTPVLVGFSNEAETGVTPEGLAYHQIPAKASALRELLLVEKPAFMQVLSGVGYEAVEASHGLNTRLIYGTHFWRDMFEMDGAHENIDQNFVVKPEFSALLRHTDLPYANSTFTRDVFFQHYGLHVPVLYSLPDDLDSTEMPPMPSATEGYVLLMNARVEKGFDVLLKVAKQLPHIHFKAVSNQSEAVVAHKLIEQAGVNNVHILPPLPDPKLYYLKARVVIVPSYRLPETFSRVVIEAQRLGIPVIGSDRGNVPVLLKQSGCSLAETDLEGWVKTINTLFADDAEWQNMRVKARSNADEYKFASQKPVLGGYIAQAKRPVLVAVGSGIGNIVQTGAAIRKLSQHLGQPVDVLVHEDWPGCGALFAGSPYVARVWRTSADAPNLDIMHVRYELAVFLQCYGQHPMPISATYTVHASTIVPFGESKGVAETRFYLETLQKILNVPYSEDDVPQLFVGSQPTSFVPESAKVLGLHAGSKAGVWAAKRWPYFEELARRAQAEGWQVISFGGPDEYVQGTQNRTGLPLPQTLEEMRGCSHFIANDSGLMHIADAMNIPTLALFGPTEVAKNGPVMPNSRVVKVEKNCSPCQYTEAMQSCACMKDISCETVWQAFQKMLICSPKNTIIN